MSNRGRGRGRGRQQQQQQQQQLPGASDSEWSVSSSDSEDLGKTRQWGAGAGSAAAAVASGAAAASITDRPADGRLKQVQQPAPIPEQQQQQQQGPPPQQQQQDVSRGVHFYALDSQDPFVLWRLQPGFVVLYDADMTFLRQLEVYQVRLCACVGLLCECVGRCMGGEGGGWASCVWVGPAACWV